MWLLFLVKIDDCEGVVMWVQSARIHQFLVGLPTDHQSDHSMQKDAVADHKHSLSVQIGPLGHFFKMGDAVLNPSHKLVFCFDVVGGVPTCLGQPLLLIDDKLR